MTADITTLAITRSAPALRRRFTERLRACAGHGDGIGLLMLIPVGSLALAGLLIVALSMISAVPPADSGRGGRSVIEESDAAETPTSIGFLGVRR